MLLVPYQPSLPINSGSIRIQMYKTQNKQVQLRLALQLLMQASHSMPLGQ